MGLNCQQMKQNEHQIISGSTLPGSPFTHPLLKRSGASLSGSLIPCRLTKPAGSVTLRICARGKKRSSTLFHREFATFLGTQQFFTQRGFSDTVFPTHTIPGIESGSGGASRPEWTPPRRINTKIPKAFQPRRPPDVSGRTGR